MEHNPFSYIDAYNAPTLQRVSEFILNEHPQTIALICLYLEENTIKEIFNNFPSELSSDVIMRMINTIDVPHKIINTVARVLKKKLKGFKDIKMFSVTDTIDKLEDALMEMDDNKLRATLENINQIDEKLFNLLAQKISIDNPERLI